MWRLGWVLLVALGTVAVVRGLWQTTYVQLTPEALAERELGRWSLWAGTLALWSAVAVAGWRWAPAPWSWGALASAGPLALLVESQGWFPPVALLISVPLVLIGAAGTLLSPPKPRAPSPVDDPPVR